MRVRANDYLYTADGRVVKDADTHLPIRADDCTILLHGRPVLKAMWADEEAGQIEVPVYDAAGLEILDRKGHGVTAIGFGHVEIRVGEPPAESQVSVDPTPVSAGPESTALEIPITVTQ